MRAPKADRPGRAMENAQGIEPAGAHINPPGITSSSDPRDGKVIRSWPETRKLAERAGRSERAKSPGSASVGLSPSVALVSEVFIPGLPPSPAAADRCTASGKLGGLRGPHIGRPACEGQGAVGTRKFPNRLLALRAEEAGVRSSCTAQAQNARRPAETERLKEQRRPRPNTIWNPLPRTTLFALFAN